MEIWWTCFSAVLQIKFLNIEWKVKNVIFIVAQNVF